MVNFFRLSKYVLAYLIILVISAAIAVGGLLRPIDLLVYKKFYLNSQIEKSVNLLKDKVIFINLPINDNYGNFLGVDYLRSQVAKLLDTIGDMNYTDNEPPVIVLDITFSNNPLALDSIKNAIDKLTNKRGIKVYASYELPSKGDPASFQSHDAFQAKVLYDSLLTGGRLNTMFNTHGNGILSYDSFELIGTTPIPSLPVKVINDYSKRGEIDLLDSINYPLPIRLPFDQIGYSDQMYSVVPDSVSTEFKRFTKQDTSINLSDKFVIVGLIDDIQDIDGNKIPGPYLVASAIIDQLNGNQFTRPSHDDIAVQLAMVLLFALFVCLIFAVLYKYVKRLQTKPHIIAILSFIIGLLLLVGFGYAMLNYTIIRPALPTLSMIWAAVLAWHFTKKFLVTGIMEGGEVYDVFISYSHGDSTWVKRHLYHPLHEFKKPDGSNLKIFFDEKSIGIGELFTTKYMRGIVDSKLFVPVMSEEYYRKNHCRNEMDLAVKRHVEKLIGLCIIALDYKYVPEEFTHINYVDVNQQADFMATLEKELFKDEKQQLDKPDIVVKLKHDQSDQKHADKPKGVEQIELNQQESNESEREDALKTKKKDQKTDKKKDKKKKADEKKAKKKEKAELKKVKKKLTKKIKKEQKKKAEKKLAKKLKKEQKKKAEKKLAKKAKNKDKKKAKKKLAKKETKEQKKKRKNT
ncbi:TIR domain-containing protein [Flavobacteriaceae bacterium LMO-SS05]